MLVLAIFSLARPYALREVTGPTATRHPTGVKYNNNNNNNNNNNSDPVGGKTLI
jgi:hypothetical protein